MYVCGWTCMWTYTYQLIAKDDIKVLNWKKNREIEKETFTRIS